MSCCYNERGTKDRVIKIGEPDKPGCRRDFSATAGLCYGSRFIEDLIMKIKGYFLKLESDAFPVSGQKLTLEDLPVEVLKLLDGYRFKKLRHSAPGVPLMQSLGAGLLLQYGLRKWSDEEKGLQQVTMKEVLDFLEQFETPLSVAYEKNGDGKPDFAKNSQNLHFSLSHSGSYCFCVLGDCTLGVDLQCRGIVPERLVEKYFSQKEKERYAACSFEEEKADCFFDMWVRKEAYGKLTGIGIARSVSVDTTDSLPPVQSGKIKWAMHGKTSDFYYAVCCLEK